MEVKSHTTSAEIKFIDNLVNRRMSKSNKLYVLKKYSAGLSKRTDWTDLDASLIFTHINNLINKLELNDET